MAFAACIFAIYGKQGLIAPDTASYVASASGLAKYGTFSVDGVPEIMRTPGYPMFLAVFIGLPYWELCVVAAQCLITGLMAALTYKFAESLSGARAGYLAAIIFTISPLTAVYTSFILTERLASFFIALLYAAIFKFLKNPGTNSVVLAAAASVCGAFVRPAAMFLPYCVIAFIIICCVARKISVPRIVAFTAVFSLISLAPIALWEHRNFQVSGYRGFSSISAMNLYFYNAAGVLAKLENKSFFDVQSELGYYDSNVYKSKHPEQSGLPRGEVFNLMAEEGKKIITDNLYVYTKVHLTGMLFILITPGTNNLVRKAWGENTPSFRRMKHGRSTLDFILVLIKEMPMTFVTFASSAVLLALAYLFAAMGVVACGKTHPLETVFLVLIAAYFIVITGGPAATDRFRDPFGFIIAIWVASGIDKICFMRKTRENSIGTSL
jgi:4-amino-4-deoxy-L-arabinose transferase-like glycosyltransferase